MADAFVCSFASLDQCQELKSRCGLLSELTVCGHKEIVILIVFQLLEFFKRDGVDSEELYPMAAALSDGQKAGLSFVSLTELLRYSFVDDDAWKKEIEQSGAKVKDVSVSGVLTTNYSEADLSAYMNKPFFFEGTADPAITAGISGFIATVTVTVQTAE